MCRFAGGGGRFLLRTMTRDRDKTASMGAVLQRKCSTSYTGPCSAIRFVCVSLRDRACAAVGLCAMPTGSSLSNEQLRSLARERLDDGRLPEAICTTLDAGYGSGESCVLCDELILPAHTEYMIADPRHGEALLFHLRCHHAWQLECIARFRGRAAAVS